MTGTSVIIGYAISTLIVICLFFAYKKWLKINTDNTFSTTVSDTGKPIKGGLNHIKIIYE